MIRFAIIAHSQEGFADLRRSHKACMQCIYNTHICQGCMRTCVKILDTRMILFAYSACLDTVCVMLRVC